MRDKKLIPARRPLPRVCGAVPDSEEATGALAKINLRTQCGAHVWVSAEICLLNVYGLVGFLYIQ